MRTLSMIVIMAIMILSSAACGGGSETEATGTDGQKPQSMVADEPAAAADDGKGVGEIKEVSLNNPLDQTMVAKGQEIYDLKCSACHKLTDMRVVGPGWKGITDRRKPEWIMNMILNVDVMLEKDPEAQKLLEECLTRMPNQNLTVDDARAVLEFMYKNDGKS